MGPDDIRNARATLGELWGLGRPLRAAELGRVLRLTGRDPGRHMLDLEAGTYAISGPIAVALELMLAGGRPGHFEDVFPPKQAEATSPEHYRSNANMTQKTTGALSAETLQALDNLSRSVRDYTATGDFRFAVPKHTTTKPARLQQRFIWRMGGTGGEEWQDVPTVVVDE